jgi:hypothetical protein
MCKTIYNNEKIVERSRGFVPSKFRICYIPPSHVAGALEVKDFKEAGVKPELEFYLFPKEERARYHR